MRGQTHQASTPLNAHLHDTRDILVTQESEQRRNGAIGARAIRLATEGSEDLSTIARRAVIRQQLLINSEHWRLTATGVTY